MEQLANIKRGQTFTFANREWIVLEKRDSAVLVLMANTLRPKPFDKRGVSDWRKSSARGYLNGPFCDDLIKAAGAQSDKILHTEVDLTASDGTFRLKCTDRVFLISVEQYRRNRDILEPLPLNWWTLTRSSTLSPNGVILIRNDGALNNHALSFIGYNGLRPALLLSSDLLIDTNRSTTEKPTEATAVIMADSINPKETASTEAVATARQ